ncbi:LapA family protein [Plectonema radiosum NIES-515]|uniref:LapA family protein n=1 Tax=Plectonema radiosum NIES-515 TaxID=2986073 RepID=A0ABT3AYC8_9CYAN|nr:LapA family protein [Plectonema radiosum]MCV3213720.1 LapA family protein [Plectonema radiosum NIES-515]
MKQINFVIIFIFCLALALFTIENTEPATIYILPRVEVQAPIAVELLLATGFGAVFAWLFSMWTQLQRQLLSTPQRKQNVRIQELESKIEQYQVEVQSLQLALPPSSDSSTKETETNVPNTRSSNV